MTLCILEQRNGASYCTECDGLPLKESHYKRQCPAAPTHVDAAQWFATYYLKQNLTSPPLADILARLERCRSANCDLLKNDVCTAQGDTDCKRRSIWFGNLTGSAACENWLPV